MLYREVQTPTGCDDLIHPGQHLSCVLPTAPWWLLLGAAIHGGAIACAVVVGLARRSGRRQGSR
jgi:hypothetical protein